MNTPPSTTTTPADVLAFWRQAGPQRWFSKDAAFDAAFRDRFLAAHESAARGEFAHWAESADGALALLILLDQFPRNAFRGTARMFATDELSRDVARRAVAAGFHVTGDPALRSFLHMPFTHSEALADQDLCVELARRIDEDSLRWAVIHRDIIARFGRFPHRNALLGRSTTEAEQTFLDEGGFAG
jgi:uncharacterized protein (DUF924 family)